MVAAALLGEPAAALMVTFTHEGRGSGTLDGVPFPDSDFVIVGIGDTDDRRSIEDEFLDIFVVPYRSGFVDIEGLGRLELVLEGSDDVETFVNNTSASVGVNRRFDVFNGPRDPMFGDWDMLSSIGPIAGEGRLLSSGLETDAGTLIFDTAPSPARFTAVVVPEPSSLSLLSFSFLMLTCLSRQYTRRRVEHGREKMRSRHG